MAATVGYATLQLIPSLKGIDKAVNDQLNSGSARAASENAGGKLGGALLSGVKKVGIGAAAAVGGVLATSLVKGWGRLTGIENAEAKLRGLGHTADGVSSIMANALDAVRGTAFAMDEAATTAAGAVAAGIKPGKELEKYLRLTADAATIAGTSMGEMGSIINKVTTAGKAQADNLNQLADRGIPIFQWLQDEYKVSATELSKMVSAGKVDAATFRKVIEDNISGAALESGATTQGAFKNMGAAMGRFGARVLKGVFPLAKEAFGGITGLFDQLSERAGPTIDRVSESLAGLVNILAKGDFTGPIFGFEEDSKLVDILFRIREGALGIPQVFADARAKVSEFLSSASFQQVKGDTLDRLGSIVEKVSTAASSAWPSIQKIAGSLAKATASVGVSTWSLFLAAVDAAASLLNTVLVPVLEKVATWMERNQVAVTVLVGAFTAYRVATTLWATATRIAAVAQGVFNAVMNANPIMLVVVAVAALAAGIYFAYQRVEWFRNAVDAVGRFFRDKLWPILKKVGGFLAGVFGAAVKVVAGYFTNVWWPAMKAIGGFISGTLWPILRAVGGFLIGVFAGAIRLVAWYFADVWWPAMQLVGGWISGTLWPILQAVGGFLIDVFGGAVRLIASYFTDLWWPAMKKVGGFVKDTLWPVLQAVGGFLIDVFAGAVKLVAKYFTDLWWPAMKRVAGWVVNTLWPIIRGIGEAFIDAGKWVWDTAQKIWTWVRDMGQRIRDAVTGVWDRLVTGFETAQKLVRFGWDTLMGWLREIPGKIGGFFSGVGDIIMAPFKAAFNGIARLWNRTVGGFGFKAPDWIPGIGGKGFTIPKMREFHTGGIVPGRGDVPILAQGGEGVFTAEQMRHLAPVGAGRVVHVHNHFHGPVAGRDGARWVAEQTRDAARRGLMPGAA